MTTIAAVNGTRPDDPDPPPCRRCGHWWPAVAAGLCALCLEHAHKHAAALLALIDTDADLTDPDVVAEWVRGVQDVATDTAVFIPPAQESDAC